MNTNKPYLYTPLPEPIRITEHVWPEGTLPLVHTRIMTFMHENYIRDCIEGILMQQTTFPVEVLIHDDASSDRTAMIVREYEMKYPKLIRAFYQNKNSHTKPDKRERRAEFSSWRIGKYEALCEGDDYWTDPLKLQKQVEFLEGNEEYSACFSNADFINEIDDTKKLFVTNLDQGEVPIEYIIMKGGGGFPTASIVYRNSNMNNELRKKVTGLPGDTLLIFILSLAGKVYFLNEILCVYRRWHGGVHSSISEDQKQLTKIRVAAVAGYLKINKLTQNKYNKYFKRKISGISLAIIRRTKFSYGCNYFRYLLLRDILRWPLLIIKTKIKRLLLGKP